MRLPFPFRSERHLTELAPPLHDSAHTITSSFSYALCRFVLDCTCGYRFDTPYIDEALEYHELHQTLAPLADRLDQDVPHTA